MSYKKYQEERKLKKTGIKPAEKKLVDNKEFMKWFREQPGYTVDKEIDLRDEADLTEVLGALPEFKKIAEDVEMNKWRFIYRRMAEEFGPQEPSVDPQLLKHPDFQVVVQDLAKAVNWTPEYVTEGVRAVLTKK